MDTGNTKVFLPVKVTLPVHPRGYGKHFPRHGQKSDCFGSSPWIRETHFAVNAGVRSARFIPVDTGNTKDSLSRHNANSVHPRGYGKHPPTLRRYDIDNGSSPWIRETLSSTIDNNIRTRFIPVDTGNTKSTS